MRILILAACAMLLGSGMAYGQSCTADGAFSDSTASFSPAGGLCSATDQIAATCANGTSLATAPDAIYQVQLGGTSSAVFSLQGTGFNPYLALMSGASCNSNDACPSGYENEGGDGATISLPSTSGLSAGTYFVVASDAAANVDCTTATTSFTLSYAGTLPVELKSFSIN